MKEARKEIKLFEGIDLKQASEKFVDYLDVDSLTIKAYRNGINCFMQYLKDNNIKQPTRLDFKAFREELKLTKSSNTTNAYLSSVRALFKYLELNGLYTNITKEVKNVKSSNVSKTQVLNIEQCREIYNNLKDKREKCIFSLAITTGLRANEIALAKIENIKLYNGETVLYVKCKKRDDESEYVKLSANVLKDIKDYIGDRTNGYIFVSTSNHNTNCGVTNKTIRLIVKNIFKRFGIEQDWISCHTLRKTMATISYESGADIVSIQQVLHHSSIATTRRYIQQSTRNNNKLEYNVSNMILGN